MNASEADRQQHPHHPHEVRIHIDQHPYKSPNPTTGEALYRLGQVKSGLNLYRDVKGEKEDVAIENGPEVVHLRDGDHFESRKPRGVTIIVEGTPHEWDKPTISYTEVVTLFDPTYPQHPETIYSVKYRNGPSQNPEGIMAPGGAPVKVKDRMKFNVSPTGQS